MTQENESQVERVPLSVWSACVGVSASRSDKVCYYSRQPQWLHSRLSLWESGRDSSPVFDVLLEWVTWILKCIPLTANPVRGFSIVFCFGLVCFFLLFLSSELFQILLSERNWSRWSSFVRDFISGKSRRAQLVYIYIFSFFQFFSGLDLSIADGCCLNLDSEYWSWLQGVDKESIEKWFCVNMRHVYI